MRRHRCGRRRVPFGVCYTSWNATTRRELRRLAGSCSYRRSLIRGTARGADLGLWRSCLCDACVAFRVFLRERPDVLVTITTTHRREVLHADGFVEFRRSTPIDLRRLAGLHDEGDCVYP